MKHLRIESADVILNDMGNGHGKIIISDDNWGYNFSYYWGAMGNSLEDFLCKINTDYFIGKLGPHENGPVNPKKTITNIRKALNEYLYSSYPWYKYPEFSAEIRHELRRMSSRGFDSVDDFFYRMDDFIENLNYYLIDDKYDRESIESIMKDAINSELWYYIVYEPHREKLYLEQFHKKLKKAIKNNKKLELKTEK